MRFELRPSFLITFAAIVVTSALNVGLATGFWAAPFITASLVLHELGHAALAWAYGVKVKGIGLGLGGAYTRRERSGRRMVEAQSALAGPAVNFMLFAGFHYLGGNLGNWVAMANLVLALSNLLPFPPCDGWKLIRAIWASPATTPVVTITGDDPSARAA
jgi:Zn-dependent protease